MATNKEDLKMDVIELERWKRSESDPHKLEYAGQPMLSSRYFRYWNSFL